MITSSLKYFVKEEGRRSYRLPEREDGAGGTSYSADIDFEFVLALAAVGKVHIHSSQVTLEFSGSCPLKCLRLPENAVLEYASSFRRDALPNGDADGRITFKFLPRGKEAAA